MNQSKILPFFIKRRGIWPPCNIGRGAHISLSAVVGRFSEIGPGAFVGRRVRIGKGAFITGQTYIEDDVLIGPHFCVSHGVFPPAGPLEWQFIHIGENAKIGANVTITKGLKIGPGSIIGAGAVLTKDVPAGEIWAGNPARKIGEV